MDLYFTSNIGAIIWQTKRFFSIRKFAEVMIYSAILVIRDDSRTFGVQGVSIGERKRTVLCSNS